MVVVKAEQRIWTGVGIRMRLSCTKIVFGLAEDNMEDKIERSGQSMTTLGLGPLSWRSEYTRHDNDYMQLFLFSGIHFLKITITIAFLNP